MNIYEEVNKGRQSEQDLIKKSLVPTFDDLKDEIRKAKSAQIGEIREWGGIKYKKEANGWSKVKSGSDTPKNDDTGKKEGGQPQDLNEAAKNASETALMNATKTSNDPAVREAAHKEMMRRKTEEAQETLKNPEAENKSDTRSQNKKDEDEADAYRKSDQGKADLENRQAAKKKETDDYNEKKKKQDEESALVSSVFDNFKKLDKDAQNTFIETIKQEVLPKYKKDLSHSTDESQKKLFESIIPIWEELIPALEKEMKEGKSK